MKNFIMITLFAALVSFCLMACSKTTAFSRPQVSDQLNVSNSTVPQSAHLASDLEVNFDKNETTANLSGGFISKNWGVLTLSLLAFAETIVRLTPSEKDNSILKLISTIINSIIPNFKKGGGVF